jgi:hypothetical protein
MIQSIRARSSAARRRGVVLIFTVAVLVLLAVIATAYLATARIDRVYLDQKGGAVTVGSSFGGDGSDGLAGAINVELRRDLFDYSAEPSPADPANPTNWRYRPTEGTVGAAPGNTYRNWDFLPETPLPPTPATLYDDLDRNTANTAQSRLDRRLYDSYLASRTPEPYSGAPSAITRDETGLGGAAATYYPGWPVISRWLEFWDDKTPVFGDLPTDPNPNNIGYFESPFKNVPPSATPTPDTYTTRRNAIPTWIKIEYGPAFVSPPSMGGKTRIFPALRFGTDVYLAGDADGDGIADSGLFPLNKVGASATLPGGLVESLPIAAGYYAPGDPEHATRWYAAIRVVDNNGLINVNTAYRRDFDPPVGVPAGGDPDTATPATTPPAGSSPNYGFFRSNIGLFEMLSNRTYTVPQTGAETADTANRDPQWIRFMTHRFGSTGPSINTSQRDYVQYGRAEALEMNLGRRPQSPGSDRAGTYKGFDKSVAPSLAYLGGLINPRESSSTLETTLYRDAYRNTPNWGATDEATDADKESRSFTFFAADPDVQVPLPGTPPQDVPMFWWHSLFDRSASRVGALTALAPGYAPPPRPIRHLLAVSNPQTTADRPRDNNTATPAWVANTIAAGHTGMEPFAGNIRPRASINTDAFGVLWRTFYETIGSAYTGSGTPADSAQSPADIGRAGATFNDASQEALYIRSALAAVNAIDMRDADDDVTTYKIKVNAASVVVAGCERQLFISQVTAPGNGVITVTLRNPYVSTDTTVPAFTANAAAYKLAIVDAGGVKRTGGVGAGNVAPGGTTILTIDPTTNPPVTTAIWFFCAPVGPTARRRIKPVITRSMRPRSTPTGCRWTSFASPAPARRPPPSAVMYA